MFKKFYFQMGRYLKQAFHEALFHHTDVDKQDNDHPLQNIQYTVLVPILAAASI